MGYLRGTKFPFALDQQGCIKDRIAGAREIKTVSQKRRRITRTIRKLRVVRRACRLFCSEGEACFLSLQARIELRFLFIHKSRSSAGLDRGRQQRLMPQRNGPGTGSTNVGCSSLQRARDATYCRAAAGNFICLAEPKAGRASHSQAPCCIGDFFLAIFGCRLGWPSMCRPTVTPPRSLAKCDSQTTQLHGSRVALDCEDPLTGSSGMHSSSNHYRPEIRVVFALPAKVRH